ncbi:GTP-binding protein [uncultured Pseudokineococcus sp.]|uniref:GTP-binding protein n=1 Tax=uncultured Pseudokineococcus sp. TaxID=1642928 RepID=UPI00343D3C07
MERVEELGGGSLRTRGSFWLPTRPGTACAWDGGGGQLSIGALRAWQAGERRSRILVTGRGEASSERVRRAFAEALATPEEMERSAWPAADDDGLSPWLGAQEPEVEGAGGDAPGRGWIA